MACVSRAVVVGGGIAGFAASIALAKAGVLCDVLELAPEPHGAALGISGRAPEALVELGIYDETYAVGTPFLPTFTAAAHHDQDGRLLSAGPTRPPTWPGYKTGMGVHRPVFLKILAEAAERAGVNIRRGVTAKWIDPSGDVSQLMLTDGTEGHYDLLVGADGVSSKTRRALFPDATRPAYAGQMSIRCMAPGEPIPGEAWFVSPRGKLGMYSLPQKLVGNWAVIHSPDPLRMEGKELYDYYLDFLNTFTAPPVLELKKLLTPEVGLVCRPFEWILLPNPWYKGQAIMIGDAAHATTAHMGMGGGMALEDAVVLGQCVAAAATLQEAFARFMQRRYERARTVVETSVALSNLEQAKASPSESMAFLSKGYQALSQPF